MNLKNIFERIEIESETNDGYDSSHIKEIVEAIKEKWYQEEEMKNFLLTDMITGEVMHIPEGMIKHYIKAEIDEYEQCCIELEVIK